MPKIEQEIKSRFNSEQHKAMLGIIYTSNWFIRIHNRVLKPFDISQQQYNVLRILRGNKDQMIMNEVIQRMLDPTPNMTRLCEKLVKKNLIQKTRCNDDKRNYKVQITSSGLKLLAEIDTLWHGSNSPENRLTDDQARQLTKLLDLIRE
jgi:DNA-binding MarR family transcriptional regulator